MFSHVAPLLVLAISSLPRATAEQCTCPQVTKRVWAPSGAHSASSDEVVESYFKLSAKAYPEGVTPRSALHRSQKLGQSTALQQVISSAKGGFGYAAEVTIGGETFELFVDTGSADTWVIESGYQCLDVDGNVVDNEVCDFGPTYNVTNSFVENEELFFSTSYGSGEYVMGTLGKEIIEIAGVEVNATFAAVFRAYYLGDGITSGILGLAYPTITSSFSGNDTSVRSAANQVPYDPIFTTMYKTGLIPPVFSLALERTTTGLAGYLALGGLPPVSYVPKFSKTPLLITTLEGYPETYDYYTITVDGWTLNCKTIAGKTSRKDKTQSKEIAKYIIDSGTDFSILPSHIAAPINAAFNPPAILNLVTFNSDIPCNAKAPLVGITIESQTFFIQPSDLILQQVDEDGGVSCYSAMIDGGDDVDEGFYILGGSWMRNVLTVFDVGAGEIRIAGRDAESLSGEDGLGRKCRR